MYPILESAFLRYPMRKKVADLFLRRGFRIDKKAKIFCGEVEISPVKIARALEVDRRVVIETAEMIADYDELFEIFSSLEPTASIRKVAKLLKFEVLEIQAEPHAVGVVSKITNIISDAGIVIRQIISDDPDIYPNPKLTIVLEKKLPAKALVKIRELDMIEKISIGS